VLKVSFSFQYSAAKELKEKSSDASESFTIIIWIVLIYFNLAGRVCAALELDNGDTFGARRGSVLDAEPQKSMRADDEGQLRALTS
jgi:hypothetical protein